ncbi:branched-chain amino acid:cation transporter, LIVCS family [Tenacibaculum sp. MAR_2010_89]|uniref:branched-chain amino acid transport system II carrier protein n=1 Tax=Tenacibaculum sp. MAR_2010_89 TaxID=1250198 RepID=UPI000895A953|nr:branched-chain amino acid transport system II carrier protein [Tenacibaculum sp. MAR_2010_89]SEE04944.1 branched-chain amino acid:cation transporter, LIVCS family [Tenacibaculum sp. MAR_2010_89]
MNKTKEILVTGFALFSLFFGAGNLLLPPLLGYNAGDNWFWVTLGFMITAVVIPILGILAHAKLQGTLYDLGKKVSPTFSLLYCVIIYIISIAIPSPRTASATHEIAIHPFFGTSPLITSCCYFALVLIFVLNRSKVLNLVGKYLTPFIVLILVLVIGIGLFSSDMIMNPSMFKTPVVSGLLEGYQTFDAIGAVVVGGVVIISLNLKGYSSYTDKKELIKKAGFIAGTGLFIIYAGLISVGAFYGSEILVDGTLSSDMQRANLLRGISIATLGNIGAVFLSVLVALACFTTAVAIITGTADYFKGLFKNSQKAYVITAVISCLFGVLVGQLDFHSIIVIALPVLMFIYPITIILILLNIAPKKLTTPVVFKIVVLITFIFSIPDFLQFIIDKKQLVSVTNLIPFSKHHLGWVIPAILSFIVVNLIKNIKRN